jgi:hypothetical protein
MPRLPVDLGLPVQELMLPTVITRWSNEERRPENTV